MQGVVVGKSLVDGRVELNLASLLETLLFNVNLFSADVQILHLVAVFLSLITLLVLAVVVSELRQSVVLTLESLVLLLQYLSIHILLLLLIQNRESFILDFVDVH